jgi:oligopeptide transport system substrate-binding protein
MKTFSLLICCALFFSGCSSSSKIEQKRTQALRINILSDPTSLDPRKARDHTAMTLMRMLFEGLTRINAEDKAELATAERVHISDDLKTYTFFLRKSYWTNKQEVTAGDFAYSWKKILDPKFPSDMAYQLYVIKNGKLAKEGKVSIDEIGVRVLDPYTLQIELENPTPYFLDLLAFPAFFPVSQKDDHENPNWAENAITYVSNGPFSLSVWKHQDHMSVVKNSLYWNAEKVKLGSIELVMVTGESELKMFEKKELDWAGSPISSLPLDALPQLKKDKNFNSKPLLGTYFLRTNVEKGPLSNSNIRRALALAINREGLIDHVLQGNQMIATSLVPPSMGLQTKPLFADGNIELARSLLAKGRHELKNSFSTITLTYPINARSHTVAQAIQQEWQKNLGLTVELKSLEYKVYIEHISNKNFELAISSWLADFNDPVNFLEIFKTKNGGTNNTGWENPEYTALLNESSATKDLLLRKELLRKSEELLISEMPIIPIFHYSMLYMLPKELKGVVLSSLGNLDFSSAYFDEQGSLQ